MTEPLYDILPGSLFQESPGYWTAALVVDGVPEYYGVTLSDMDPKMTIKQAFNAERANGGKKLL